MPTTDSRSPGDTAAPASRAGALRFAGARHVAIWIGVLFWLGVTSLVVLGLLRERREAETHAQQEAASLAAVLEENTARTFEGVDVALAGIADSLSRQNARPNDATVRQMLRSRLNYLPAVRALFVIAPDGWIVHDTDYPATPHVPLADRDYFRQYLRDPALQQALSPALKSRSGTGWFVASTRRIVGPHGEFKGVVVAAVQLDWLSRLYTRLELRPGLALALLQRDGRLLARFPARDDLVGRSFADLALFSTYLAHQPAGAYIEDGPPLAFPRIVSYRAVEKQPLVVVLMMPVANVMATWRRTAAGAAAGMIVFTLLTAAGVLFFLQKQEQGRRALALRMEQAEADAAAQANARFRTFFEQGCFFSCVLALDGTVEEANQGGLAASGITRDDIVGRRLWDCEWWNAGQGQRQAMHDAVAAAARGTTSHVDAACRLADGTALLLEVAFSPIRGVDDKVLSVAALGVDITQRKHHEERLRALADELANADRLKGEFLATLSHELRNVLAPISNASAILGRVDGKSAAGQRAREMMHTQLRQMRSLVDDLLDVSRVNSGKVRLEPEAVDLRELLSTAADAAQPLMERPQHVFTTSWPQEPLPVQVDRGRILQVFANLLGNAAKYTPAGGRICMKARREGREVVVEVVDNGVGIPVDAQARVFNMFEQVSDNMGHAQGGLGIGLSLVQKLVALHGGHVEAFSEGAGHGSSFTVYLPLAADVAAHGLVQEGEAGTGARPLSEAPK